MTTEKKCKHCGKTFTVKNYWHECCSKNCRDKYSKKKHQKNQQLYNKACAWCKKTFTTNSSHAKYCSDKCLKLSRPIASYKLRFAILYRDDFRCQYCGATPQDGIKLHVDHIIAKKNRGTDEITNLITSCEICNKGKKDIILSENPQVGFSEKAIELLSTNILNRKELKKLGLYSAYQKFIKLV